DKLTLSLGLRYFLVSPTEGGEPKDHLLMAAVLMAALPCIALFFVAQRYFVRGIVMSGIKGKARRGPTPAARAARSPARSGRRRASAPAPRGAPLRRSGSRRRRGRASRT